MRKVAAVVGVVLGGLLFLLLATHDLEYLARPVGRCMVQVQPDILLGVAPAWTTEFACA